MSRQARALKKIYNFIVRLERKKVKWKSGGDPVRVVLDEDFCPGECYFWCEGKEWKGED